MMRYFQLQLKRVAKLLPYIITATAILLAFFVLAFNYVSLSKQDSVAFNLGIVGSPEDSYLAAGLEMIQAYDSSRFTVDFIQMDEIQARNALEKGDIGAYVVIPEDYIFNAVNGKLGALKYVSTTGAADLTVLFKDEITAVVSDIIITCEQSMYGVEDTLAMKDLDERSAGYISQISLTYVDYLLDRQNMYDLQVLGVHDSLGLDGYLFSGISVLIISLLLIPVCPIFIKKDLEFERLLLSKNIGAVLQVAGEYGAVFIVYSLIFVVIGIVTTGISFFLPRELYRLTALFSINNLSVVIVVVFALSSCCYLFSTLTKNVVSGVILYFSAVLALCFASGCLYPLSFFPDLMKNFAVILPQYYCTTAFSSAITNDAAYSHVMLLLAMGMLMLIISALLRGLQLRKGQS